MRETSGQIIRNLSAVFMRKIENMNVPGNESKGKFSEIKKKTVFTEKIIDFLK